MTRLVPIPDDPQARVACSACLERTGGRADAGYQFEFADHDRFGDEVFVLYGPIGNLRRRPIAGIGAAYVLGVPIEGVLICVSCRLTAGEQRHPGGPVPSDKGPINPHRAFDPVSGEEVEVPPRPAQGPKGQWYDPPDVIDL